MAHAAWQPARHPPKRSLAATCGRPAPVPAPPPPPPRGPDTPRRGAQDTPCATCIDGSGNVACCQCKQYSKHTQNEIHLTNEAVSRAKRFLRSDSSDKLKMPRSSGGTYSKPDARVKLIPAEDITYVQHQKPYGRTVGSAGLQKRHCRRSVTPPPSSRKVSLVGSTSVTQNPTPPVSSYNSYLSPKRLKTDENEHSFAWEYISSSVTSRMTSLKNPPSPNCKSSQPASTNLNTDASLRNLDRMDSTKALARSQGSSILHSQGQSCQKRSASLPKEAVINPLSPSPKQVRASHPSEDPLGTKAGPSSKSVCAPENGYSRSRSCNLTTRNTAARVLQAPIVEPALLSPTSVLSERPAEVYPDTRTAAPIMQEPSVKPVLLSPIPVVSETSIKRKNISPTHSPQSAARAQHLALPKERNLVDKNIPPTHSPQSPAPRQHTTLSNQRNPGASINCGKSSEFHHKSISIQERGVPLILHTKLHKKHYQSEARWRGNFHVTGELIHTCDGLEAHFPFEICVRVYETSKQMPGTLNLEAVPLSQLWPKKFKMKPPDGQDIGLCFISSHQRPHRSFDNLIEKVSSHTGLCTSIGDTELAVFSSKLLAPHYQRKDGRFYFWGVFGKRIRKKRRQPNNHIKSIRTSDPSQPNEDSCDKSEGIGMNLELTKGGETENAKTDIDMALDARGGEETDMGNSEEIANTMDVIGDKVIASDNYEGVPKALDLTGGNKTDRVNECVAMLRTPDSNPAYSCVAPAASLLNRCCSLDSASKSTFSLADSPCPSATRSSAGPDLMLGIPPGFSLDIPPGFTKAHCCLQTGDTALSYVHASPSLDTPPGFPVDIPPGFTESNRRLPTIVSAGPETGVSTPDTEKKPLIKFSLNVPRPIKTEVLPGFTILHAVKREPGLPAIDEATKKQAPSSLVASASSVGKDGKSDEMKITHDKIRVEQDEEREFPKTRRLSDLYRTPWSSAEKQSNRRNRDPLVPLEPSPSDTTKTLKVNGRIALNIGTDGQTLSSNQDLRNGKL